MTFYISILSCLKDSLININQRNREEKTIEDSYLRECDSTVVTAVCLRFHRLVQMGRIRTKEILFIAKILIRKISGGQIDIIETSCLVIVIAFIIGLTIFLRTYTEIYPSIS